MNRLHVSNRGCLTPGSSLLQTSIPCWWALVSRQQFGRTWRSACHSVEFFIAVAVICIRDLRFEYRGRWSTPWQHMRFLYPCCNILTALFPTAPADLVLGCPIRSNHWSLTTIMTLSVDLLVSIFLALEDDD